jgi:hypothetical protein
MANFALNANYSTPSLPEETQYSWRGSIDGPGPTTNFFLDLSAGFMMAFLLSTIIETWLWWQQRRPNVPFPLSYSVKRAWRAIGLGKRR